MWEYCTRSKLDLDENPGILDASDNMRIADFNSLMNFYLKTSTLRVVDDEVIMELFSYFTNRDMILTASLMQFDTAIQEPENTLLQIEEVEMHNEMETDMVTFGSLFFDIPSEAELFFKNYKGREPKDVWAEFVTFESNGINMSKLDNLIFQKSLSGKKEQ